MRSGHFLGTHRLSKRKYSILRRKQKAFSRANNALRTTNSGYLEDARSERKSLGMLKSTKKKRFLKESFKALLKDITRQLQSILFFSQVDSGQLV